MALCPNCGTLFPKTRCDKRFCSSDCQVKWQARQKVEGALIVSLAKVWRKHRGTTDVAKKAFSELVSILDFLNAEDREAGRPDASEHVRATLASGRFIDRVRSPARTKRGGRE